MQYITFNQNHTIIAITWIFERVATTTDYIPINIVLYAKIYNIIAIAHG